MGNAEEGRGEGAIADRQTLKYPKKRAISGILYLADELSFCPHGIMKEVIVGQTDSVLEFCLVGPS